MILLLDFGVGSSSSWPWSPPTRGESEIGGIHGAYSVNSPANAIIPRRPGVFGTGPQPRAGAPVAYQHGRPTAPPGRPPLRRNRGDGRRAGAGAGAARCGRGYARECRVRDVANLGTLGQPAGR